MTSPNTSTRWQPKTYAELEAAVADGRIEENHWYEYKEDATSSDSFKKKLACGLASLANDGGSLTLGVAEPEDGRFDMAPTPLAGLPEKISQIASTRCDPPLYVVCRALEHDDTGNGALIIEVPPSPLAPHQSDGSYWRRDDTTKSKMTDADVARLHDARRTRQVTAREAIDQERARDPLGNAWGDESRLYIVARPMASRPDLLSSRIGTSELHGLVSELRLNEPLGKNLGSIWRGGYSNQPRATGWGWFTGDISGRRYSAESDTGSKAVPQDLELSDDGTVTFFYAHASRTTKYDECFVDDATILFMVHYIVSLAGRLGEVSGYGGTWLLAVGITDVAGKASLLCADPMNYSGGFAPFSAPEYLEGTTASTAEMFTDAQAVAWRLVSRLTRALGTTQFYIRG